MMNNETVLSVQDLTISFRTINGMVRAVRGVSFDLKRGETVAIVGESGSGKSVSIKAIMGILAGNAVVDSGHIMYEGRDLLTLSEKEYHKIRGSKIGLIFQDPIDSLNPRMTVEEIIGEGLKYRGMKSAEERREIVYDMLNKVGLTHEHASRYPHEFSGGQRQRIGIARALVVKPKLIIADEPVSALDVSAQAQVINLLNDLKEELGLTIMFVAHDLSVVKYFSTRVAVMYYGKIVEMAPSEELYRHPLHPYTRALLSAVPQPNPILERSRQRISYDKVRDHIEMDEPRMMREILPDHFVYCNSKEFERYQAML